MNTAAEELGHIEMLATAVALNLEGAPVFVKDELAADPVAGAVLGGLKYDEPSLRRTAGYAG